MMRTAKNHILIFALIVFIFGNFNFAKGNITELNLNPMNTINNAGITGISTEDIWKEFKFNFPFDLNKVNINTNIPLSPKFNTSQDIPNIDLRQFLTPKDVSSDDLGKAIKAIITLVIEIFLEVIYITSQVLKLVLEFLR